MENPDTVAPVWLLLTRLGEAQLLLPALLLAVLALAWRADSRRLALAWLVGTALAAALTTATKLAFIGHGLGWAALDFTGISGHAMFAAAVLPPLLGLVAAAWDGAPDAGRSGRWARAGVLAGGLLAAAIGGSRVAVQAHSWSEVGAGLLLGGAVSALALRLGPLPALRWGGAGSAGRSARWAAPALLAWGLAGMAAAPPSRTHDWVTALALAQSGRDQPFERAQLHLAWRTGALRHPPPAQPGSLQPR